MDQAISQDNALKQAIADYPTARLISESIIEHEVRGILAESGNTNPKEEAKRGKTGPWIITITLLAALAVSYYQWNRHTRQTKVYAEVMNDYTPPINQGTRGSITNSEILDQAIKEFDLRNMENSYALFKSIKPKSDSIYWYLSHIALINGDVYEAKHHSKKITDDELRNNVMQYVDKIISE